MSAEYEASTRALLNAIFTNDNHRLPTVQIHWLLIASLQLIIVSLNGWVLMHLARNRGFEQSRHVCLHKGPSAIISKQLGRR